jgi:hypothetical protein
MVMIPFVVIVDESGPEEGADIKPKCIVVRLKNLETLIEGFTLFMPDVEFKIYTKVEYEACKKKKETDPDNQ